VTLENYLERRREQKERIPLAEALDVLISIAEGVAAVHRGGIAHRDIKPSNIILAPGNRVVLTDFGLMLPEIETKKITDVRGTPMYMAPEVIRNEIAPGEAHLIDIYALGALAFELVSGEPPFDSDNIGVLLHMHIQDDVPDLPDAPPKLAALIREMLAKEPHARPQQLEGVVWRLRAIRTDARSPEPSRAFRVLIVDDDPDIARLLGAYVKQAVPTADVAIATGSRQALEIARKKQPHLVILDLMMPEMNGVELYMVLRGERIAERCTVIAVSAGARDADVELLYELGVSHFVAKGPEMRKRVSEITKEVYGLVSPSALPSPG
jgi:serine/threonine-protein kinase